MRPYLRLFYASLKGRKLQSDDVEINCSSRESTAWVGRVNSIVWCTNCLLTGCLHLWSN